jgi:hypothetical protein
MKTDFFGRGLLALSLAAAPAALRAQEVPLPPRHTFALQAGAALIGTRDQNASPLAYRGQLAQLGLAYQHRTARAEWFAGAQAAHGSFYAKDYPDRMVYFGDTPVPLRTNLAAVRVQVHYLRRVAKFAGGEVLLGGGLQQTLHYPQSEPYVGMTSVTSLPLVAKVRYGLGAKAVVEAQGQYAVAGLITRLPWHNSLSRPEETSQLRAFYRNNTRFDSGYRLRQAALGLTAVRTLSPRWQASLGYDFALLRHQEPRPLTTTSHHLNLGVQLTF